MNKPKTVKVGGHTYKEDAAGIKEGSIK